MTPMLRNLLIGGTVAGVARFKFNKSWTIAALAALGAVIIWDMAVDPD